MGRVLVTGRPGVGKTTLTLRVVDALRERGHDPAGFVTGEIRRGGRRTGFTVTGLRSGAEHLLAVDGGPGPRVGRYGVDVDAFESVALNELEAGLDLAAVLVADEIGKMELLSVRFCDLLPAVFEARRLLATVHAHRHPVTDELKRRPDVHVLRLARDIPDGLVEALVARVES